MSAGHAAALSGHPLAGVYSHAGMVSYQGEKMSKSLGNLVLVSRLRASGTDPRAIRLALLAHQYRTNWEWTDAELSGAEARLERWSAAFRGQAVPGSADAAAVVEGLRSALTDDLDTPRALAIVDAAAAHPLDDPALLARAIDALLGIAL